MRHTIPFDTHAYVKRLTSVGVPEAQAEVHAEAIADLVNDELATKKDLEQLELRVRGELRELELRLKHDLTIRLGAVVGAGVAIVAALVKLL
jgi:hypothetical protein